MYYNIKAVLSPSDRLVGFTNVFEGTKNGFLSLVKGDIEPSWRDKFSFGTLYGGSIEKDEEGFKKLSFKNGAFWNFSTLDKDIMFRVYEGIARNDDFAFGMGIDYVEELTPRFVDGENFIKCHPGIIVNENMGDGTMRAMSIMGDGDHFLDVLERNTREKLASIAPNVDNTVVINSINGELYKKKTAHINRHVEIFNEGILSITAPAETMQVLSCIGIGEGTHIGFGHLTPTSDPTRRASNMRPLRSNEVRKTSMGYVLPEPAPIESGAYGE